MNGQELFDLWAPESSPWSAWAKPALFASAAPFGGDPGAPQLPDPGAALLTALEAGARAAVVVDLPGADAVRFGIALARHGMRPVPMFNTTSGGLALIDMDQVIPALVSGAAVLKDLAIREDAPPAFLLDSRRLSHSGDSGGGLYDNRWIVFPQDFPSGAALRSRGCDRVLLVNAPDAPAMKDLDDVLARWQRAGVRIERLSPGTGRTPEPYRPSRWWPMRLLFLFVLVGMGLRRNSAGGFGSRIPESGSGSGWG